MKVVYMIFLLLHGVIHLLGFLKAFSIAEINELKLEISKFTGVVWLITALMFFGLAVLLLLNKEWVWAPAMIAVILSQILIIFSWQDAKFGTVANIIILIVVIFQFASWNYNNQVEQKIANLLASQTMATEIGTVTEQSLESLPAAVKKWLKKTGMVGKEEIQTVYFKQKGQMRLEPDKDWTSAEAEQYVTINRPGFIWDVKMDMFPIIKVVGNDSFMDGEAAMKIKIGSLIPVVNESQNDKVNESTLHRYLMEIPWYPSVALSPYISWEEIDGLSSKATMTYEGVTGSAIYHFEESGELLKVSAMRYKDTDEDSVRMECIGEVKGYSTINGLKIPTKMDVSWMMDGGKFTWFQIEIFDLQYNITN